MQIAWDAVGTREFQTGLDRGVLYYWDRKTSLPAAVPWNGLTSVEDNSGDAESSSYYLDGKKFLTRRVVADYEGKLEAFTYPDEFEQFLGSHVSDSGIIFTGQDLPLMFGLSYRTRVGNDLDSDAGYRIHILYNLTAQESNRSYSTISDSPEPSVFSWDLSALPESFASLRPTSHVIIDSTKLSPSALAAVESVIYGTTNTAPRLPTSVDYNIWG